MKKKKCVFYNQAPYKPKSLWDVLKWKVTSKPEPWPKWIDDQPKEIPKFPNALDDLSVTFVNHSTVLIQYHQTVILTDPIWSKRASPARFAGPKRVRAPGIRLNDIKKIDLLLLSHDHYDHMDKRTLKRIAKKHQPLVLTGLNNGDLLRSFGLKNVVEMDWWQSIEFRGMTIHFTPTQHFSGRTFAARMTTLWGGFVLESPYGHVYFAGDTAVGPHDEQLKNKFRKFRLSLLPIGAYEPNKFMKQSHMNPSEAFATHQFINSQTSIGIHFGTFSGLTDEGYDDPVKTLKKLQKESKNPNFVVLDFGETKWIK